VIEQFREAVASCHDSTAAIGDKDYERRQAEKVRALDLTTKRSRAIALSDIVSRRAFALSDCGEIAPHVYNDKMPMVRPELRPHRRQLAQLLEALMMAIMGEDAL